MSNTQLNLGVFQCAAGGLSGGERLERLARAIVGAQDGDAAKPDLVVCPELFGSGYHVFDELLTRAQPPQGDFHRRIAKLATQFDTAIVYGYPEKASAGIYNSAAFVGADGRLLANHRKCLNSPGDYEGRYFTPGDCMTSLDYGGLRIAILICYEIEFPESARSAARDGAHLIVAPTALGAQWEVVASRLVPTRAFENGVWVAYANHAGHENGLDYLGGSKIVAPDGVIESDAGNEECLISFRIDSARVEAAQRRLPYLQDCLKLP